MEATIESRVKETYIEDFCVDDSFDSKKDLASRSNYEDAADFIICDAIINYRNHKKENLAGELINEYIKTTRISRDTLDYELYKTAFKNVLNKYVTNLNGYIKKELETAIKEIDAIEHPSIKNKREIKIAKKPFWKKIFLF